MAWMKASRDRHTCKQTQTQTSRRKTDTEKGREPNKRTRHR